MNAFSENTESSNALKPMLCEVAITHRFLCERGAKWLRNTGNWKFKSQYVLVEFVSSCRENPDLFGLRGSKNICIEVKVSRADFKRDIKKPHRQTAGIGATRYYLCPKGMIKPAEIINGWGLMEYNSEYDMIEVVKESEYFHIRDYESEESLMYSVIRRLAGTPRIIDFRNVT
jgi:hypothetical protein